MYNILSHFYLNNLVQIQLYIKGINIIFIFHICGNLFVYQFWATNSHKIDTRKWRCRTRVWNLFTKAGCDSKINTTPTQKKYSRASGFVRIYKTTVLELIDVFKRVLKLFERKMEM